jgi:putative membrane protein
LAWYVLAATPLAFLRGVSVRAAGAVSPARVLGKASLAAAYLVGADLFLDPLAVASGAWSWPEGGAWFGVPIGNLAGWFLAGLAIHVPYLWLEGEPRRDPEVERRADRALRAGALLLTALGFLAATLRTGSPTPAAAAAAVLAPYWVRALPRRVASGQPSVS